MLVLTTLQNICQLLIHVWRQANPATRRSNQGPSDLCKLYSQMLYQLSYSRLDTNHRIPSTYTEHAA